MGERVTKERLLKAIRSFERAAIEYRRACRSGEQPRLSKDGTSYAIMKHRLFMASRPTTHKGARDA
jgi:hypothetical protein